MSWPQPGAETLTTAVQTPIAIDEPIAVVEPIEAGPPDEGAGPGPAGLAITSALVVLPLVGLAAGICWLALGNGVSMLDVGLGVGLYFLSGHGVTVGYHRLFTHRSFRAAPWLRVALAVAGSLALEGGVVSWVANHRLHHRLSDRPGDPHSPYRYGTSGWALVRGMVWSHVAWLFRAPPADVDRYARDLKGDPAIALVDRLFPVLAVVSLLLPFTIGWWATGSLSAGGWAVLWAGAVRITLLHHVTWSVNSLCHVLGARPNRTRDRSANVSPLAVLSMGESWHNNHHAFPSSARHGLGPRQVDTSARLIWLFERLGWATDVKWAAPLG
ncbi:MAG TPA: acyl-CoA desaturase [Acidimicrobiales bacterium]|nr:acyl-CoA desaturase [Acidimicrobiales bacterium]